MTEGTLNTLIALAEAHEGRMEMHCCGILALRTDNDYNVFIDMEDGRTLTPDEIGEKLANDAIIEWKMQNQTHFQKILGAMM